MKDLIKGYMAWRDSTTEQERVDYMTENLKKLKELRLAFADQHGFSFKRPQNFKKCIVIYWKAIVARKHQINQKKLEEYIQLTHHLSDKYELWDEKHLLFDSELRLAKIGIYSFSSWDRPVWAIPDAHKRLQKYVLNRLPDWAKVSIKL
jgi:hypothetical protein